MLSCLVLTILVGDTIDINLLSSGREPRQLVHQVEVHRVSRLISGLSTADSKFLSIVRRARMVSAGDNKIYTGSGL
jgi:hypothetical protein